MFQSLNDGLDYWERPVISSSAFLDHRLVAYVHIYTHSQKKGREKM
jgi:hypothetical protein